MKKLFSTRYSAGAFNTAMFILRVGLGLLLMKHGYDKMTNFANTPMIEFLGLSKNVTLSLVIFAEFFCSIFVVLGLFTRLACIPIIITMVVELAKAHNWDALDKGQLPTLFLIGFLVLLFTGPGKASVDGMISK